MEEQFSDLGVRVGLEQAQIHLALRVEPHEHRDARQHRQLRDRVRGALRSPFHSPEVAHAEPGLVNVQDALAVGHELDELHREALAADQVPVRVGVDGDRGDLPVAHAEPIDHDVSDVSAFGFQSQVLLEILLHRADGVDEGVLLVHLLHRISNHLMALLPGLSHRHQIAQEALVPLCLAHEPRHRLLADPELSSHLMMLLMLHQDLMDDLDLVAGRYAGAPLLPFAPGWRHHVIEVRLANGFGD